MEATMLGRVAGNKNASRFRTGRLETTQMVIPGLISQYVKEDNGQVSDDEDGLGPLERENVNRTLQLLASGSEMGGATVDILGRPIKHQLPLVAPAIRSSATPVFDRSQAAPPVVGVSRPTAPPVIATAPSAPVSVAEAPAPARKLSR